jgi:hypothetical protein
VRRGRVLLGAVAVACALVVPSVGAQPVAAPIHPQVGIGDENVAMFTDPQFLALGIKQVRFDVSWDVFSKSYHDHYRLSILEAWLALAHADGLTPLISFDHSDRKGQNGKLPTAAQFSSAFKEFRAYYPWVTEFVTWDEANFYGEAISHNPRRAAAYYHALRHDCPTCTILAPDLLDIRDRFQAVPMVRWAREFIRDAHVQPAVWALNNYVGANSLSTASTKQLLRAVHGDVWLVETGGIVALPHRGRVGFPLTQKHAAKVDHFLLTRMAALSPRIQRIYLYEWRPVRRHAGWDSALLDYDGAPRPGYDVLADALAAWGVAPDCLISIAPPPCAGATGASGATGSSAATASSGATGPAQNAGARPQSPGPP